MKTLLLISISLLAGCATPDYSHLTFEQRMMILDRSRLYFPPVQYHPMQIQQPVQPTNCRWITPQQLSCY